MGIPRSLAKKDQGVLIMVSLRRSVLPLLSLVGAGEFATHLVRFLHELISQPSLRAEHRLR